MALIPSESLNFPDSFRATVGWRVTEKTPPGARITRRTELNREKNGDSKTAEIPADRTSSAQPPCSEPAVPQSEPIKRKASEQPKSSEKVTVWLENSKEDVRAESKLEQEQPKQEVIAEEPKLQQDQPKEEVKAEEPKQVAQEQLVTKPADAPKVAAAPPVETKPEETRDVPTEPTPNIALAPAGATLTGADAAALLSKIFFSPAAATTELEAIKSKTQSSEPPSEPVAADTEADEKSSPSAAGVSSQSESEPNKELTKEAAKSAKAPRQEFSINAQPASLLSEPLSDDQQSNTVNIQNAAETKHVFDLIAAAAVRGILKAEPAQTTQPVTVPPPAEPSAELSTPITARTHIVTPEATQKVLDEIAPGPERSVLNTPAFPTTPPTTTSPSPITQAEKPSVQPVAAQTSNAPSAPSDSAASATDAAAQPIPKTPAKIRIQPRKFKPRPIPPPTEQTEFAETEVTPEITVPESTAYAEVAAAKGSIPTPLPKTKTPPKPAYREWAERGKPLPPRGDAAPELFTARDTRNRWIRFGLGESGALAVFVVLLSYLLNHKFPHPTLKLLIFILMFAVGALAVALPVMFIRNHPSQWQRRAFELPAGSR